MAGGQHFTAPVAERLKAFYRQQTSPYHVYYDHGQRGQFLYCWVGPAYTPPFSARHLARVDLIVADPKSSKVHHIIEIEDTSSNPKAVIGDVMAVLLGDGLAFQQRHDWQVGVWTTLSVLAYSKKPLTPAQQARLDGLQTHFNRLLPHLETDNSALGRVKLSTFQDEAELFLQLRDAGPPAGEMEGQG